MVCSMLDCSLLIMALPVLKLRWNVGTALTVIVDEYQGPGLIDGIFYMISACYPIIARIL